MRAEEGLGKKAKEKEPGAPKKGVREDGLILWLVLFLK